MKDHAGRSIVSRLRIAPRRSERWARQAVVLASVVGCASMAHAANYTWDASGTSPSAPTDGGGTWDTAVTNWVTGTNPTSDVGWSNGTNVAIFGTNSSAAGTVTLASALTVSGITFNASGSGSYTLTGGTLAAPNGSDLNITANVDATINTAFVGAAGTWSNLNVTTGAGVLTLTGSSSFSGPNLQIYGGGTLAVSSMANPGPLGNPGGGVRIRGGTLRWTGAQTSSSRVIRIYEQGGTIEIGSGASGVLTLSGVSTNQSGTLSASRGFTLAGSNLSASGAISSSLLEWATVTNNAKTWLYKNGSGTWSLSGTNTYSGGTTISAGTLKTGATAGTLGTGNVTVLNSGSVLDLGNASSIADTATLSLAAGTTLKMSFASATESIGVLNLGGMIFNSPTTFSSANNYLGFGSFFTGSTSTATLQVIPEPGSVCLAAMAGSWLAVRRKPRRKA